MKPGPKPQPQKRLSTTAIEYAAALEDVQPSLFPLPSRFPDYRRVSCACGCGLWFYARRSPGRPPGFVNEEHYRRELNRRRREARR